MIHRAQRTAAWMLAAMALWCQTSAAPFAQSEGDGASVIRSVDAAVQRRFEHVLGFTDDEHYQVFRGKDETHPDAEMTVKVTYRKGVGKSYEIKSESGSEIIRRFALHPMLDSEKTVNLPGNVEQSWFNSANYEMKLRSARTELIGGRECYVLDVKAKRKAPNMIDGTLWVDAKDGNIVKLDGIASKSASAFAGTTRLMRQYNEIEGYPMATHARAESNSALFGRTVVTIDYSQYQLQLAPAK
jgi:hypothetical protein